MDRLFKRLTFIVFPFWWCGFLIPGLAGLSEVDSREKVDLVIPSVILEGEQLTMYCQFNVDKNSSIYTVKWYKGSREIFRYQPKQYPSKKTLQFKEIQLVIDENQSDMNKLVLKKVPMALRGNVSCEVTWEPSFTTIMKTGHLVVVSPPEYKPTLEVKVAAPALYGSMGRPEVDKVTTVNIADYLTANCTSGPAMPAPNLTYYINGLESKFHKGVTIKSTEVRESENKTETRTAIMSLKLDYSHILNKKIRVKCTASLFNLYNETSVEFIGELPRERSVTASGYGLLGKNGDTRSQPGKLVWSITTIGVCGKLVLPLLKSLL